MTGTETGETRAQQRERERAEWDYLTDQLGVLWPNYDCFCGSLEDLRRTVAELERKAARDRPARSHAARANGTGGADTAAAPQDSPVARAGLRANRQIAEDARDVDQDQSRREQLTRWHTADHAHEHRADSDLGDSDAG